MVTELVAQELESVARKMQNHANDARLSRDALAWCLLDDVHFGLAYIVGVLGAACPETIDDLERGHSRLNEAWRAARVASSARSVVRA